MKDEFFRFVKSIMVISCGIIFGGAVIAVFDYLLYDLGQNLVAIIFMFVVMIIVMLFANSLD